MMKLPPSPENFTSVIAERVLMLVEDGKQRRTRVRIGLPVRDVVTARGTDWRCPISISAAGTKQPIEGFGVDSLQALVNALKLLEAKIGAIERRRRARFEWLGMESHGVPKIGSASLRKRQRPNKPIHATRKRARA